MIPIAPIFVSRIGYEATVVFFCFWSFQMLQLGAWDLMFHLCYYNISYRLKILRSFIRSIVESRIDGKKINNICDDLMPLADERLKRLRTTGYIFDRICQAVNELSATFSLSVLVILLILMIESAVCLFFSVNSLTFDAFSSNTNYTFAAVFTWSFLKVLMMLITAESHVTEVSLKFRF